MRFAAPSEVVALWGIPSNAGSLENAKIALDISTTLIEEHVGSRLSRIQYYDYFDYRISRYRSKFSSIALRLSAGFVDKDTLTVRESSDGLPMAVGGGTLLDSSYYRLDAQRGLLTLLKDVTVGDETLLIAYEAGFNFSEDGTLDDDPVAPGWLPNAAKVAAKRIVETNPANIVSRKVNIFNDLQNSLHSTMSIMLNPHIRPRLGLTWPTRSETEIG